MQAGKLRHRVAIQTAALVADGQGGQTETWSTLVERWASIEPLTTPERFQLEQITPGTTHRLRIRGGSGIDQDSRILFGARVFEVLSLRDLEERGRQVEVLAREVG